MSTVTVRIGDEARDAQLALTTPGCGGGGGRPANTHELDIIDLWNKLHLNEAGFSGGNLVAFLKQLRRLVS